uniref:Nucleoporin n=1 Tax=Talaromyces marneffei PM1 TaxID=1077442 RepID=A0A093V7L7_TALMA
MSFGGFGGSNTFGQNTQQQSSGFGGSGFGGSGTTGGFGSNTTAFGAANTGTGGSVFGSNTSGGFGSGGAFGSNQTQTNSLFGGNKPSGFGSTATTGGSLFGSNTATTTSSGFGSGGFGSTGTGTTGAFGSNTAANANPFGAKPASGFGTTTTTPSTGFGGTGGGFGQTTAPAFGGGAGAGTAFAGQTPAPEGTANPPFNPVTEKDPNSTTNNVYQSISYMPPYQRYSFEELRLADYQAGRRFANASGQPGAFGAPAFGGSGFGQPATGAFGTTGGGFGTAATSAPAFGAQTQTTTGGFGTNTTQTNSLFGQKPATSLFGGNTTATTQPSLFGGTTATTGGFGAANTTNTTSTGFGGSSLFGNQQQQQKPGLFGSQTPATTTTGGFGSTPGFGTNTNATSTTTPFGSSNTTTGFGNAQQTGTTSAFGGGFGQQAQNQAKPGLFGNTQQQQGGTGLFGGSGTTGTSLFGNTQQQQPQGTSLFGGGQPQQTGGTGLFGGAQQQQEQKPSLFGGLGTNTTTTTGTSAFGGLGGNQPAQTGTTSLFGSNQAQQQQKPSLFGNTGGTSLFGGSATAQPTGSLFGGQTQQQPTAGFGTSMFSTSQQNQQQLPAQQQAQAPAPGSFQASLLEGNPYGNQSIFSGLPGQNAPSPGPLATPLSASMRQKQRTPLPIYKITPNAANRLITPPRRQGYGFSYSTYGSPASASSVSSFNGSLLGSTSLRGGNVNGSFGRSFGKSFSTSNLRKSFDPDSDSVLAPGALTGSASRYSSGSLKRLTIDRSLRNDLFQRPSASPAPITNGEDAAQSPDKLKKRVSFEAPTNGALVRAETESAEPTAEELGFLRSIRKGEQVNGTNGTALGKAKKPEMEQARVSELAVVPEAGVPTTNGTSKTGVTVDPQPGEYWMKPSRAELSKMSRDQLKHVEGFTVGRQKCGQVTFDRPVDLTTIDLDNVLGGIVQITVRSITVYPDEATKPPRGKGLNVPSTLRIENSWPRGRDRKTSSSIISGPLFDKHVDRLSKVTNTEFVTYEKDTGIWVFRVAHFTTYGLEYEDDEGESLNQSTLSAGPDTPTPKVRRDAGDRTAETTVNSEFDSTISFDDSIADDTFDFKKRKLVPGAFGLEEGGIEDEEMSLAEEDDDGSTVENDITGSVSLQDVDDVTESITSDVSIDDGDMEMAGSFPVPRGDDESEDLTDIALRTSHWGTPSKPSLDLSGDWADQLQRTISPRKQNRDLLREKQADAFVDRNSPNKRPESRATTAGKTKSITSSIDLMNSLFAHKGVQAGSLGKKQKGQLKAFELSHTKTPKTFASSSFELSSDEAAFHRTRKPRWANKDALVMINDGHSKVQSSDQPWSSGISLGEIDVLRFADAAESIDVLEAQRRQSSIRLIDSAPSARINSFDFRSFVQSSTGPERYVWQLVNILFNDEIEDDISAGVPPQLRNNFLHRIKKDRLSRLWENIVREKHGEDVGNLVLPEEVAIAYLTQHRVEDACKILVDSGDLHLATMLAQIGRDSVIRSNMQKQVESWRQHNVYSEFSEPIRALYELLAGNALRSIGRSSGALEDRASTFTLSERFELDWIQAFGLRLWYSITEDEPLEVAVARFFEDITTGDEPAFPFPAHLEQELAGLHQNANSRFLESPLWVILKVYAATTSTNVASDLKVNLPDAISPEAVSGNRLSGRLSFQLHQALVTIVGQNDRVAIDKARTDQLTWSYASELVASNAMEPALFVLLHLSRAGDREHAIKETLGQFAASLPTPLSQDGKPDDIWNYLVQALQLPESWIWVAKGLYARYSGDFANEVGYLIRAKNWNEAHSTLCRVVGPRTIIECDWSILSQLLNGFGESPDRKVRGWSSGGAVYEDYLRLVTAQGPRDTNVLKRLIASLGFMGEKIKQTSGLEGLEERVAFMEMSRVVAGWSAREEDGVELSAILRLPLTGDARVAHTAEIGRRYYSMVMATAH